MFLGRYVILVIYYITDKFYSTSETILIPDNLNLDGGSPKKQCKSVLRPIFNDSNILGYK